MARLARYLGTRNSGPAVKVNTSLDNFNFGIDRTLLNA